MFWAVLGIGECPSVNFIDSELEFAIAPWQHEQQPYSGVRSCHVCVCYIICVSSYRPNSLNGAQRGYV